MDCGGEAVLNVLVAIPVFNEERYLPNVLKAVRRHANDVLVIDDGSTDRTSDLLARQRVATIRHPENRGYGQSLIDAFDYADRNGFDWVVTIDCDEQHEPAQIPDFFESLRRDDADIISGSRYLVEHAGDDDAPPDRRRINHTVCELLSQLYGLRLTDSFCGFKAHRTSAMRRLSLDEPGYAFPVQLWVQAARAGLRIRELPVRRIYRDHSRQFGGTLDDPAARLQHYLEVLVREAAREQASPSPSSRTTPCRCLINE
ncbi:MAG: glycosyltransferase family 2 protein [Planctomycetota bacterium]|nr:MAG: glycosyltransferase family 2 protein [Planctomycetota bacterium]